MKRLFLTICVLFTIFWIRPVLVSASYVAPDGNEYEYKVSASTGNYNTRYFTIYSNNKMCTVTNVEYSGGKTILGLIPANEIDYCVGGLGTKSGSVIMQYGGAGKYPSDAVVNTNVSDIGYYCWRNNTTIPDINNALSDYNCTNDEINLPNFATYDDALEYLSAQDIDYDTVYYSPLIPNVDFSVVLNTSGVPVNDIDSEYNAFSVNVNSNVGTEYYIQIGYKVHVPNKMALGVNDNGTAYYSAITYNNATFQNVYALSDNQVAFTGSVNSALFTWSRQEVTSSNWITVSSLDGQTSFINGSISAYNDLMSYIMPLYGKKIEIFMRYFVIQDNQVIVGAWSHWNNTYPKQYTQELPANYIPFHDVPGLEQTNNNTDYQNNSDSISTIGQTTGQTNVSVYNSNVPNYPDYPTAVTYNHDNILTQMIETTQKLPSFFGEFTGFCKECMTILPAEIWEVIAFGFMCSILVMIVKVL